MSKSFDKFIGIDYSGAQTPTASLKGLRVYLAEGAGPPEEVHPPPSPRKYRTRKVVARWLVECLSGYLPTLVGVNHCFPFRCDTLKSTACAQTGQLPGLINRFT